MFGLLGFLYISKSFSYNILIFAICFFEGINFFRFLFLFALTLSFSIHNNSSKYFVCKYNHFIYKNAEFCLTNNMRGNFKSCFLSINTFERLYLSILNSFKSSSASSYFASSFIASSLLRRASSFSGISSIALSKAANASENLFKRISAFPIFT